MKNIASKILTGIATLAVVAMSTVAFAENIPQVVTVLKVDGDARFSTDNKTWKTLKRGDVLKPGTVIQTAANSTVDVTMGEKAQTQQAPKTPAPLTLRGIDTSALPPATSSGGDGKGNVIHIYESSVLAIDKLVLEKTGVDEVAETQLDLRAGQIMGNVKKLSAASRYEVKIPNGVAGIRGTIYVVSASGTVYCLEGQVIISYVNSQGQLVTATISGGSSFNPFAGPNGTTAPIPPALQVALLNTYNSITPGPTGPSSLPFNGTTINVSPSGNL